MREKGFHPSRSLAFAGIRVPILRISTGIHQWHRMQNLVVYHGHVGRGLLVAGGEGLAHLVPGLVAGGEGLAHLVPGLVAGGEGLAHLVPGLLHAVRACEPGRRLTPCKVQGGDALAYYRTLPQ